MHTAALAAHPAPERQIDSTTEFAAWQVIRRNRTVVAFERGKIATALSKAFRAVKGESSSASTQLREQIQTLTDNVVQAFRRRLPGGGTIPIEDIQDQVELVLMRLGEHDVARAYVLYREKRAAARLQTAQASVSVLRVRNGDVLEPLEENSLLQRCIWACADQTTDNVSATSLVEQAMKNCYDGITRSEIDKALIFAARAFIERHPAYNFVTAKLLWASLYQEVTGLNPMEQDLMASTIAHLPTSLRQGVEAGLLDPRLLTFDLEALQAALQPERDQRLGYMGLQILYDRYLLQDEQRHIELPTHFFMRVAMGLALQEIHREQRAIEFYHLLSQGNFMCSTPTLFNSGTLRPQLSSCYLTSVPDDLDGIFSAIKENALLQKYAGGLGNDWTPVRALGSVIRGTQGQSQGVIPFLKVVNDTAVAVNQGGKRKGAVCAYLETWHLDIEEFLDLRKNTGDDRRRTHDMNTAHWIPDLFMQRVFEDGDWTLFSPVDVPDLHDSYGRQFAQRYCAYEQQAQSGAIKLFKTVKAVDLWRKMLTMLFETGHPWITFKDPCNLRSPQQHVGVVHSSNLCTEITLNTSVDETAVCNLGSVNLLQHLHDGKLDQTKLQTTIRTAMRMLDNVIDLNFYPSMKARNANVQHRPVGLGIMGYSDCLYALGLSHSSPEAVQFADHSMEMVSNYALLASTELAQERGAYSSFRGSLWDQGILPIDSIGLLCAQRDTPVDCDTSANMDWQVVRTRVAQYGLRNSLCLAIAPTATIANIVGVTASIEPTYQNLFVKSNLSGEFTVLNNALVYDLIALGIWDDAMLADLKYFDGSVQSIERIPDALKAKYATAFEIDPMWLIEAAARRQKWLDQAQSLNLYLAYPSGRKLDEIYKLAWKRGLKTTYYLRTLGASHAEKSSLDPSHASHRDAGSTSPARKANATACSLDNAVCEVCQ